MLGDFNVDLQKYNTNSDISNFLDSMYLSLLFPHIASTYTSGNLVIAWSDHHVQLMVNQINASKDNTEDQLYHCLQKVEKKNKDTISAQLENIEWETEVCFELNNVNLSS